MGASGAAAVAASAIARLLRRQQSSAPPQRNQNSEAGATNPRIHDLKTSFGGNFETEFKMIRTIPPWKLPGSLSPERLG